MISRVSFFRRVAFSAVLGFMFCGLCAAQALGPWRQGDFAESKTVADDRPNEQSRAIVAENYVPLVEEKLVIGEKGKLGFRVAPRNAEWAGILITTLDGTPMKRADMKGYKVEVYDAVTGKKIEGLLYWERAKRPP